MEVFRQTQKPHLLRPPVRAELPPPPGPGRFGRLRRYASKADPRDVLQEVFFNVYRYPHRFNSRARRRLPRVVGDDRAEHGAQAPALAR